MKYLADSAIDETVVYFSIIIIIVIIVIIIIIIIIIYWNKRQSKTVSKYQLYVFKRLFGYRAFGSTLNIVNK